MVARLTGGQVPGFVSSPSVGEVGEDSPEGASSVAASGSAAVASCGSMGSIARRCFEGNRSRLRIGLYSRWTSLSDACAGQAGDADYGEEVREDLLLLFLEALINLIGRKGKTVAGVQADQLGRLPERSAMEFDVFGRPDGADHSGLGSQSPFANLERGGSPEKSSALRTKFPSQSPQVNRGLCGALRVRNEICLIESERASRLVHGESPSDHDILEEQEWVLACLRLVAAVVETVRTFRAQSRVGVEQLPASNSLGSYEADSSPLTATRGGAAVQAAVAGAVSDHDGAAFVAGGGVGLGFEGQLVLFGDGGAGDDLLLGDGDRSGGGAIPRH